MTWELPCLLTTKDYTILEAMLYRAIDCGDPLVLMLRRKLAGAAVVFRRDIPSNIVTINSRVVYRVEEWEAETRIVVQEGESEVAGVTLPITTPRGLALLGMPADEGATYLLPDGSEESIYVEHIVYQPEAVQRAITSSNIVPIGYDPAARVCVPTVTSLSAQRKVRQAQLRGSDGDDPGPTAA